LDLNIIGRSGARKLYTTLNGGIVMRAVMHLEQQTTGGKGLKPNSIIVTGSRIK
jgi:DNA gyrase/topoisomerase IV subunit A